MYYEINIELRRTPVLGLIAGIPKVMIVASIAPEVSDTRLREAHHRIANNLALIAGFVRLQTSKLAKSGDTLSAADAYLLLEEIGVRIQTIGQLHHLLGANAGAARVNLGEYFAGLRHPLGIRSAPTARSN